MTVLAIHQPYWTIFGVRRCQGCGQRLSWRKKSPKRHCEDRKREWRRYHQHTTLTERVQTAQSTQYLFTVTEELSILEHENRECALAVVR
jgi:hypothetical protein